MKEQKIPAIKNGTVIDHIPSSKTPKVLQILDLGKAKDIVSIGMNLTSSKMVSKGIIKIASHELTKEQIDKIAVLAPGVTVNVIRDYHVKEKKKAEIGEHIEKIMKCPNPRCITNVEKVNTCFLVLQKEPLSVRCRFCERSFGSKEIILL